MRALLCGVAKTIATYIETRATAQLRTSAGGGSRNCACSHPQALPPDRLQQLKHEQKGQGCAKGQRQVVAVQWAEPE
jgi:hypothetical protein